MAFRSLLLLVIALLSLTLMTVPYPVDEHQPVRQSIEQEITDIKTSVDTFTHYASLLDAKTTYVHIKLLETYVWLLTRSQRDIAEAASAEGKLDFASLAKMEAINTKSAEILAKAKAVWASHEARQAERLERKSLIKKSLDNVASTFVPPPKTDITPELINASLAMQPQDTATVSSVMPDFQSGVVSYLVQLNGLFASSMILNASTSLPCDTVGSNSEPDLVLLPKSVNNGTPQTVVPNCLIIAVNMYTPNVINYWVQKEDGSIFSLTGDNKIHHFGQIDTSMSTSLVLRTASSSNTKREANIEDLQDQGYDTVISRQEIVPINCKYPCPHFTMKKIVGNSDVCGCMYSDKASNIQARGISVPDVHTAVMTIEACHMMTCINNGGKHAVYNPFTKTCWCFDPVYVDVNANGLD